MQGTVRDEKIAEMIGEIVEGIGEDGAVLVENAHGTETSYQYLEGIHWDEGWHSPSFLREHEAIVRLIDPRILITDMPIEKPDELVPVLDACARAGVRALMVIAPEINDAALSLLVVNRERGILESVAVKTPSHGDQRTGSWRTSPSARAVAASVASSASRSPRPRWTISVRRVRPGLGRGRSASWAGTPAETRSGRGSSRRAPSWRPSRTTTGFASGSRSGSASSPDRRS